MDDANEIKLRLKLKTALFEALIRTKKVRIGYQSSGVKFNESAPLVLPSLNQIHDFSVGQRVFLGDTYYDWLTGGRWIISFREASYTAARSMGCYICGFFELTGHVVNSRIKFSDIFCALAVRLDDRIKVLKVSDENSPILLFWVEGLKLMHVPVVL